MISRFATRSLGTALSVALLAGLTPVASFASEATPSENGSASLSVQTLDAYDLLSDDYTYTVQGGKATINRYTGATGSDAQVAIPSEIDGYPVVSIGKSAFAELNIKAVFVPEGVTSIGDGAFEWCYDLESVSLPSTLTSIGSGAFYNCQGLGEIEVPASVTHVGSGAFLGVGDPCTITVYNEQLRDLLVNGDDKYIYTGGNTEVVLAETKDSEKRQADVAQIVVSVSVDQAEARKLLDLVNSARAAAGAPALEWDSSLEEAALQRAAEIALYFSHTRPNGESCFTAFPAYTTAGENIAAGQASATAVNTSWTNSSGHYRNMVSTNFTSMAAACVTVNGRHYWVEVFDGGSGTGFSSAAIVDDSVHLDIAIKPELASMTMSTPDNLAVSEAADMTKLVKVNGVSLASDMGLSWKTSDSSVLSVNSEGVVKALASGDATITVSFQADASVSASVQCTVESAISGMFSDVDAAANRAGGYDELWYTEYLEYVVNEGLMGGYTSGVNAGKFGVSDSISRGQVATILYRSACADDPSLEAKYGSTNNSAEYAETASFKDLKPRRYYTAALNWAKAEGVMTGDGSTNYTTVRPDAAVSRQELSVMLSRFAEYLGENVASSQSLSKYPDASKVASWAEDSVQWAVENGILGGASKLNPTSGANRAEAAKMLTVAVRDAIE